MDNGDSFSVSQRNKNWLKIKIKEDGYKGYIKNKKFQNFIKSTHKISVLKANIYKFPNKKKKINEMTFGSKIKVIDKKLKFFKFSKGWISTDDVKPKSYKGKNPSKKSLFLKMLNISGVENLLKE